MPVFEALIDRHSAEPGEVIERVIFSKLVNHRNAVKRGEVSREDQARLAGKIRQYAAKVRQQT